jgi:hypothetical protein
LVLSFQGSVAQPLGAVGMAWRYVEQKFYNRYLFSDVLRSKKASKILFSYRIYYHQEVLLATGCSLEKWFK